MNFKNKKISNKRLNKKQKFKIAENNIDKDKDYLSSMMEWAVEFCETLVG